MGAVSARWRRWCRRVPPCSTGHGMARALRLIAHQPRLGRAMGAAWQLRSAAREHAARCPWPAVRRVRLSGSACPRRAMAPVAIRLLHRLVGGCCGRKPLIGSRWCSGGRGSRQCGRRRQDDALIRAERQQRIRPPMVVTKLYRAAAWHDFRNDRANLRRGRAQLRAVRRQQAVLVGQP